MKIPILNEMLETLALSLEEYRLKAIPLISNIRYGIPGEILFDFNGEKISIPEPMDVLLVGDGSKRYRKKSAQWIIRKHFDILIKKLPKNS